MQYLNDNLLEVLFQFAHNACEILLQYLNSLHQVEEPMPDQSLVCQILLK